MKPDQETIDAMIKCLEKYNNAKTAEEGFGALNNLIGIGEDLLAQQSSESTTEEK